MTPHFLHRTVAKRKKAYCAPAFLLVFLIAAFQSLRQPSSLRSSYSTIADRFLASSSNSTIAEYLRTLTLHPHLAGSEPSLSTSDYVFSHFSFLGLSTRRVSYFPLLSYPSKRNVVLRFSNGSTLTVSDSYENRADDLVVEPYHAYSPSGSVTTEVVFANFGRESDYHALAALGVNVTARVVLVRRGGGMRRARAVEVAERNGAAAVLMFTEYDNEGRNTKEFRGGVERGTVMRKSIGDPLTPGWAAVEGGEMLNTGDVARVFPNIPSLPISFDDADVILKTLSGPETPSLWNVTNTRLGPGPTVVTMNYEQERKISEIRNVIAVIEGSVEPDRFVILGNHRDAWTYGAVDPNSGTSTLLDIARRFSLLIKSGWKPRRSIVLCSWDGEEFGMVGSTEWVEQNEIHLRGKAVAYLNVDCAVQGPGLFVGATPQLDSLIHQILSEVDNIETENQTSCMYNDVENHNITIHRLGGVDSDFAPFLHHIGVPCVDLYYGKDFPVYHTAFDSYEWMVKNADPCFHRHVSSKNNCVRGSKKVVSDDECKRVVANIWGMIAVRLADDDVLPFNYFSYAKEIQKHERLLRGLVGESIDLRPLERAIENLFLAASVEAEVKACGDLKIREVNDRLTLAERAFLDADGIHGRPWFKHLIYGLCGEFEEDINMFPGIMEVMSRSALRGGNRTAAIQHEIWRVVRAVERSASALRGHIF